MVTFIKSFLEIYGCKPDWDLKRDIAGKLEKLEKRTQKAIAELIRDRLKEEDLANAVTAASNFNEDLED